MGRDILIGLVVTFLLLLVCKLIAYGVDFLFTKFVCSKCECKHCCKVNSKNTKDNIIEATENHTKNS